MSANPLPLSLVVDVEVSISPLAPATPQFNVGLIVGSTNVIPSIGVNSRTRQYTAGNYATQMLTDGFAANSPEYIAAGLYFSQKPQAQTLEIGRQDLTAIGTVGIGAAGANYVAGDIVGVTQGGAQAGYVKVATVGAGGAVTGLAIIGGEQGTGYAIANGLATTGGSGAGLTVDILTVGETPLQALTACRAASPAWWAAMVIGAVTADHEAIAAWAQGVTPQLCYFYTTQDAAALSGAAGNVFSTLKAAEYSRAYGDYATTQAGLAPNNIYKSAAVMGVAMGSNTGLSASYFQVKFKQLVGIIAEPLTAAQVATIEGNNGNVYVNYANSYTWEEQGTVASGQFLDEILFLDMLASAFQYNILDVLTENPAVPQTDAGQTQLLDAVNAACANLASIGFIATGVWEGSTINVGGQILLANGESLPNGYKAVSPKYSTQSTADRQARKSMPIYVAIIEAGAVSSVLIGVYVQR